MMSSNNPRNGYGSNSSKPSSSSFLSLSSYSRFRLSRSQRIPSSSSSSDDSIPYSLRAISSAVENSLSSIQLGLCSIKRCTLGVYEKDIPGGATLKECLQTSSNSNLLSNWRWRMQVALDLARRLEHIHHHRGMVHGAIMSSTVVVTEHDSSNACVSLFGAGEFRKRGLEDDGKISQKSDVYAFGVVILELISGQAAARKWEEDEGVLLETARETISREREPEHEEIRRRRRVMQFVDWQLHNSFPMETAEGLIKVALNCVEDAPDLRPKMTSVVEDIQQLCLDSKGYRQWAVGSTRARRGEALAEPRRLRPDSPRPV